MAWVNPLDSTDPLGTGLVSGGAAELRGLKAAVVERMNTLVQDFAVATPLVWIGAVAFLNAGQPVSGGVGTGATIVAPGAFCYDTINKVMYVNINTKASPTWAPILLGDSV